VPSARPFPRIQINNPYKSYAQQNARELADLLTSSNANVVMPKEPEIHPARRSESLMDGLLG
jgi:hypothetical protein